MKLLTRRPSRDCFGEGICNLADLIRGLVDELKAIVLDSGGEPLSEMSAGFLSFRSENRIAAPDIGDDRMGSAV